MYYLLLSLIVCASFPLHAFQDEVCLSDGGESPLCTSVPSLDETAVLIPRSKRKRTEAEKESIAHKMPRCNSLIGGLDMSLSEDIFRKQALRHLALQQKQVIDTQATHALAYKWCEGRAYHMSNELAPIADPALLPVLRVGIDFSDLEGLALSQIMSSLNALSLQRVITELNLANFDLEIIPGVMYTLAELTVLNLGGNKLGAAQNFSASVDLTGLKRLRELNLSYNFIRALPKKAFVSDSLKVLLLSGNLLEEVDSKSLPAMVQVVALDNNRLKRMPMLDDKSCLRALDISSNTIKKFDCTTLPSGIQFIDATCNQIEEVAEDGKWSMGRDGQILLGNNKLHAFPMKLCELKNLRYVDFSCNAIDRMPILSRRSLPNGGCIDMRANYSLESGSQLKVGDVRSVQADANQFRHRTKKIRILAAITMDTQEGELRRKWPKPEITY